MATPSDDSDDVPISASVPLLPRKDIATILLDISTRIGAVEGQNRLILAEQFRSSERRSDIYKLHEQNQLALQKLDHGLDNVVSDLQSLKPKVDRVDGACADIAAMKPHVEDYKTFKLKLAVAAIMVSAVITGAINLIALAIANLATIKTVIRDILK